jgi:DNA polymerase III delta subunit
VRLLLQARDRTQAGEGGEEVGRALGLSPFPLRKILDQMRLFRLEALEAMLRRVLEADLQIKTGQLEPGLALDLLIADLCAAATGRAGPGEARRRAPAPGR